MKEMINKYMEMLNEVKAFGLSIEDNEDFWDENYDAMEEIECMNEHIEACKSILKRAIK